MAFVTGCNLISRTAPGEKYRAPDGRWLTRGGDAPCGMPAASDWYRRYGNPFRLETAPGMECEPAIVAERRRRPGIMAQTSASAWVSVSRRRAVKARRCLHGSIAAGPQRPQQARRNHRRAEQHEAACDHGYAATNLQAAAEHQKADARHGNQCDAGCDGAQSDALDPADREPRMGSIPQGRPVKARSHRRAQAQCIASNTPPRAAARRCGRAGHTSTVPCAVW